MSHDRRNYMRRLRKLRSLQRLAAGGDESARVELLRKKKVYAAQAVKKRELAESRRKLHRSAQAEFQRIVDICNNMTA